MATPLIGRGIEHVWVARIEGDVGDTRVLADSQHGLPRLAPIRGLVQTPIASRIPERPLYGHVDDIRVPGIDQNLGDVLGTLQPDLGEAGAAIDRLVQSVAISHAALAVILARAHPDDQVVPGIDHHAADRVRPVAVKDRRPRGARVCRLPDTPGSGRDVPGAVLHRIHGNVADPARHQGRPYPLIGSHPRRRPPCLHHQLPMTRRWPPARVPGPSATSPLSVGKRAPRSSPHPFAVL